MHGSDYVIDFIFQLGNLEKKWQHHEQNNFVLKECILWFYSTEQMLVQSCIKAYIVSTCI